MMSNDQIQMAIDALEYYARKHERNVDGTENQCASHQFAPRAGKALTALRQHQQDGGWRPIDSAPKDGTRIIVWVEHNPKLGHKPEYSHATNAKWIDLNGGGWTWDGLCGLITHWQPLPPAPKKENDDDSDR